MLGLFLNLLQHLLVVIGHIVILYISGHCLHLAVGDKAALNPEGLAAADGRVEHIALAHQLFRALGIQNDPGFHGGGHGEGDAGGNVGLHQARNHIGGGPLGGDDQVHTGSTAHLGNAADGILHLLGGNQHQVRQLVDDDNHLGQLLAVFLGFHNAVVGFQIPDTGITHQLIPAQHFRNRPLQRTGGLFGIGNHGNQQMGNTVVNAQLHHLGVHHDELYILGAGLVEKADDDGVHANRLTGTGSTGDQHMGHFGNVAHNAVAPDVLAHGEGGLSLCPGKFRRIDDLPQGHGGHGTVGHLNAHNGNLTGNGGNPHAGGAQAQGNVIGAGGELAEPHALVQLHLIPGDAGTPGDIDDVGIDAEAGQGLIQPGGILPHLLGAVGIDADGPAQQINGREAIGIPFSLPLTLGNLHGHLSGGFLGLFCGHLAGLFSGFLRHRLPDRGSLPHRLDGLAFLYKNGHPLGDFRLFQFLGLLLHGNTGALRFHGAVEGGINVQTDGIHHIGGLGRGSGFHPFLLGLRRGLFRRLYRCLRGPGLLHRLAGLGLRLHRLVGRQRGGNLLPLAALLLDAFIGNVVHHQGSGFHIGALFLLFLRILLPGTVDNGPDNAGDGDFHGGQKGQHRGKPQYQIGNHAAAEPTHQHGKAAAEHTAGAAFQTAGIEVRDDPEALRHALTLDHQMEDAAAEEYKQRQANAAHGGAMLPAKGLDQKQIDQGGNGEIEPGLTQQAQNHGLHGPQQSAVRIHGYGQEQGKQHHTEHRDQHIGRKAPGKIRISLFYFLRRLFLGRGSFAAGFSGGRFLFRTGSRLFSAGAAFLFSHKSLLLRDEIQKEHKQGQAPAVKREDGKTDVFPGGPQQTDAQEGARKSGQPRCQTHQNNPEGDTGKPRPHNADKIVDTDAGGNQDTGNEGIVGSVFPIHAQNGADGNHGADGGNAGENGQGAAQADEQPVHPGHTPGVLIAGGQELGDVQNQTVEKQESGNGQQRAAEEEDLVVKDIGKNNGNGGGPQKPEIHQAFCIQRPAALFLGNPGKGQGPADPDQLGPAAEIESQGNRGMEKQQHKVAVYRGAEDLQQQDPVGAGRNRQNIRCTGKETIKHTLQPIHIQPPPLHSHFTL